MKVGLLSQWFDPEPGGGVLPGVLGRELVQRGHQVKVLTGFPNYPSGQLYAGYRQRSRSVEEPSPGLTVTRVPLFPSHDGGALKRSFNYLSFAASAGALGASSLRDCDAFWVYNSPATVGTVAEWIGWRSKRRFLLHVMDLWPESVLGSSLLKPGMTSRAAQASLTAIVKRTHSRASLVAYTSPGQADVLQARGVAHEKLRYVPVWADEDVFFPRPIRRDVLSAPLEEAALVVMYAGSMGHVQALDAAVRAAARSKVEGIHLVFVGSGVAEPGLRRLADELDASNVHFLGRQPPSSMGEIVAAADVHLISLADTPLLRITMPSKIQSLLASARPVIAMCAGDAADAITDSGAGQPVAPGDDRALAGVLRDWARTSADDRRRLGANGRAYYDKQFSRQHLVGVLEQLLEDLVG
jgi:colanic acid biosynthesis glycosyl transferase WcaI